MTAQKIDLRLTGLRCDIPLDQGAVNSSVACAVSAAIAIQEAALPPVAYTYSFARNHVAPKKK